MYVLGISEIDNDAGVTLIEDGEVVCAINEERFSRIKRHRGFPHRSVEWVLEFAKTSLRDVDMIAVARTDPEEFPERFHRYREKVRAFDYFDRSDPSPLWCKMLNLLINNYRAVGRAERLSSDMSAEIRQWIQANGCAHKVRRVHHHYAHAACAYWGSGFERALAVTLDGQGEGTSSEIYLVDHGKFTKLVDITRPNSMGLLYSSITKLLGFKSGRHEGKVTGLAAYAEPDPRLLDEFQRLAYFRKPGCFAAPCVYGNHFRLGLLLRRFGRQQMAAAVQRVLEDVISEYVSHWVRETGEKKVVLAGGVVGNVKLNQRIFEIDGVREIFVFPHMADGGLGYGAAQVAYRETTGDTSFRGIREVYWGPAYSDAEVRATLERHGLRYQRMNDVEDHIAGLLARKQVVAHFDGRLEFGPRALGNRSILFHAGDRTVNDWLNKRLNRTEFMPFAPVTLEEDAPANYIALEGAELASRFMTITFGCSDRMKAECPAVVHVDGTARPQLVTAESNPRIHRILRAYKRLTGIGSVINTSFNMHEEPIVCSPEDAVRAFLQGHLDHLAIGDYLVTHPDLVETAELPPGGSRPSA